MIRLDPAHPPVWRTATCLQFGVDAVLRIEEPAPWQERLVKELERGVPDPGYRGLAVALGATAADAEAFLRTLTPALVSHERSVAAEATVRIPEGFSAATAERVVSAMAGAGVDVIVEDALTRPDPHVHGTVVLVAQHVVEPRRTAALMAADVPHLPVVFTADRCEIGPLVHPGRSACLRCVEEQRHAADPAWPWILAQLVDRAPVAVSPAVALEAGLVAAQLLSAAPAPTGRSIAVHDDLRPRRWREHRRAPDCGCRSLGGTATAAAPDDRRRAPTTPPATAPPA